MGNCLVLQERSEAVLEYESPPMRIRQVLSELSAHTLLPTVRNLGPDSPEDKVTADKRRVRFRGPETEENCERSGVMRIKLVVSKKDLEDMLRRGRVSYKDLVSHFKNEQSREHDDNGLYDDDCNRSRVGWKPVLETIHE